MNRTNPSNKQRKLINLKKLIDTIHLFPKNLVPTDSILTFTYFFVNDCLTL